MSDLICNSAGGRADRCLSLPQPVPQWLLLPPPAQHRLMLPRRNNDSMRQHARYSDVPTATMHALPRATRPPTQPSANTTLGIESQCSWYLFG
jgi:hypothetical protein